jgi:hypothetical protein
VGIMLVGFAEGLGAAKTYAAREGYQVFPNRELIGLGAANLAAGLSNGMVVNGSLSKTAVNGSAGAGLGATGHRHLRSMGCNPCGYLLARRDTSTGHDLASDLRQHWRDRFGEDLENTLVAATYLAWALRAMGRRGRHPPHKCPHKRTLIGLTHVS